MVRVGVLAMQGDFERHLQMLRRTDPTAEAVLVRNEQALHSVAGLIIPGGESTTVGKLLDRYGLGKAIQDAAAHGMPVWGTCMGMILMAKHIEGGAPYSLSLLDIEVRRNAFGSQVHSFEDTVHTELFHDPLTAVFIRAPIVTKMGPGVEPIATYNNSVVAVRQNHLIGTSFHPELTEDNRCHAWFLRLVSEKSEKPRSEG